MSPTRRLAFQLLTATCIAGAIAQAQSSTTQLAPRELARVEAESPQGLLVAINAVRVTSRGAIFVNDRASRRVIMLDPDLRPVKTVIDDSPATGGFYGQFATRLFAMPGDSTVFLDSQSGTFVVIDPQGRVARHVPLERITGRAALEHVYAAVPAFDARDRLVYRAAGRSQHELFALARSSVKTEAEALPLLRLDLLNGRVDTATSVRMYQQREVPQRGLDGRTWSMPALNPAPTVDEWTMLADGTIAVVRGEDYHIDFIGPDGGLVKGAPIPYPPRELSSRDKVALIDSSRAVRARMLAAGIPLGREVAPLPGAVFHSAPPVTVMTLGNAVVGVGTEPPQGQPRDEWVSPDELPDRLPVFSAGSVRADADGNIWIQTVHFTQERGSFVYDVVNRSGALVDRVQVPAETSLVGFGPDGVVLLAQRTADAVKLVRAHHVVRGRIP
jgi:hypothetical protein